MNNVYPFRSVRPIKDETLVSINGGNAWDRDEGYDDFIRADGRSRLGEPVHLTIRNPTLLERFWRAAPDVLMCLVLLNFAGLILALAFDRPFAGSCFFLGMGVAAATLFARLWIGGTK